MWEYNPCSNKLARFRSFLTNFVAYLNSLSNSISYLSIVILPWVRQRNCCCNCFFLFLVKYLWNRGSLSYSQDLNLSLVKPWFFPHTSHLLDLNSYSCQTWVSPHQNTSLHGMPSQSYLPNAKPHPNWWCPQMVVVLNFWIPWWFSPCVPWWRRRKRRRRPCWLPKLSLLSY